MNEYYTLKYMRILISYREKITYSNMIFDDGLYRTLRLVLSLDNVLDISRIPLMVLSRKDTLPRASPATSICLLCQYKKLS
jgi:hypothetical protein